MSVGFFELSRSTRADTALHSRVVIAQRRAMALIIGTGELSVAVDGKIPTLRLRDVSDDLVIFAAAAS